MGRDLLGIKTIETCLGYFQDTKKMIYVKECFVKLQREIDLLWYYVSEGEFPVALELYQQIQFKHKIDKKALFEPYALSLIKEQKLLKSFSIY